MDSSLQHFVVLGGGPAGWLAATCLNRVLNRFRPGQVTVSVLESAVPASATTSAMGARNLPRVLKMLGIDEQALLRHAEASFSHGIRFVDWRGDSLEQASSFFVPFDSAYGTHDLDLGEAWTIDRTLSAQCDYAHAVSIQPSLADELRCPKLSGSRAYDAPLAYSYQIDPHALAGVLRDVATRRGVRSLMGRCAEAIRDASGRVIAVRADSGASIRGDFFIDCDDSLADPRQAHTHAAFVSYDRDLLCDRQISLELPAERDRRVRPCVDVHTATAGWIGECDLALVRRVSYAYSSAFVSDHAAERELRAYVRTDETSLASFERFNAGRCREAWVGNTLALGPAAGAIEPLHVPELGLVAAALETFVEHLPQHAAGHEALRSRCNSQIAVLYDRARDLTALNYRLSRRDDTAFWRANRHDLGVSESLREDLELWSHRLPRPTDRSDAGGLIDHHAYRCVLAGMGRIAAGSPYEAFISPTAAISAFQHLERSRTHALAVFPDHGDYLRSLGEQQLSLAFAS
jgi:tryptophan halogenase